MTEDEFKKERSKRLAKESRKRKKEYVEILEKKVKSLEN